MKAHEVTSIPLQPGSKIETPLIRVDTAKWCSVSVKGTFRSSDSEHDPRYRFPFHYTVYDSSGKVLVAEKRDFAYDGGTRVTRVGGTANITQDYKDFKVPSPGEIRVDAQIDPDRLSAATTDALRLVVYDNVSEHSRAVGAGCVVMVAGLLAAVGGLIVFLIGLAQTRRLQSLQTN
jgi:hypothetical protein